MTSDSDLVKRLRSPATAFYEFAADNGALLREAADRIEALLGENAKLRKDIRAETEDWRDRLDELAREREWQPIATAPKDGTRILVPYPVFKNNSLTPDHHVIYTVRWEGVGWVSDFAWMLHEDPTRWMPLPAPPEAK